MREAKQNPLVHEQKDQVCYAFECRRSLFLSNRICIARIRASSVFVKKLKHLSESNIKELETDMIFYQEKTRSGFNHVTKKPEYKKKKVPLADSSELNNKKLNLDFINAKLKETFIGLWLTDKHLKKVKPKKAVSFVFNGLTRSFNSADMTMGGRFYGGWWQQIPKIYRPYITIHNSFTTEFDYSSLHPSILYHWDSLSLDEDAYHLNCSWFRPDLHRKSIKKIFNIILNASSEKVAYNAISYKLNKGVFPVPLQEVLEAVLNKHSAISHYFYTGVWGKLQRTDSDIAEYCMLEMLNQFNAPILPIHDSFIVQMDHLYNLQQVMIEAYKHIVGGDITLGENRIVLHDLLENSNTSDYMTYFKYAEIYCNKKGMSSQPHDVPDVFPF